MHKQKYFSATSAISTVTWLIVAMMVASICLITFFLHVIDNQNKAAMIGRFAAATKHEMQRMMDVSFEYTNWDLGYQKTVIEKDKTWQQQNYNDYLIPRYKLSIVALVKTEHHIDILGLEAGESVGNAMSLLNSPSIKLKLGAARQNKSDYSGIGFITLLRGFPYVVVAEPFTDEQTGKVQNPALLVMARRLDTDTLAQFSKDYDLPAVWLKQNETKSDGVWPMHELNGMTVAYLTWKIDKVTTAYVPYLALFLILLLSISLLIVRNVLKRGERSRSEYEEELYIAATTDPLTGVYNRRYFTGYTKHQIKLYSKLNRPLSLLALDLDHFKNVNDTYGHHVGDLALVHFCKICQEVLREIDVLGRIGGEEFAILLPGLDLIEATKMAQKIRHSLYEQPLHHNKMFLMLTVSIGVAELKSETNFEKLLLQADQAMYKAKDNGRNQVCAFEHSPVEEEQ